MPAESLQPSFKCAFQDLPAIGQFVRASLVRDLDHLRTRSIKYKGDTFLTGYDAGLKAVNELVNPATFTAQHTKLTEQMVTNAVTIRPLLNDLEIRLYDAVDVGRQNPTGPQLLVAPADFGLKPLRTAITDHDAEGIAFHGRDLLQRLTASAAILALVEYPATEQAQLAALVKQLAEDNAARNTLISDRDAGVQANLKVLNDFYDDYLARVLLDGKKAYKETDVAKTHDYTFAKLKARVAAQRPAKTKKATPTA